MRDHPIRVMLRIYTATDGSLWHIEHTCPPVPTRACDWTYWHDDYDGAPDAYDHRHGDAPTLEECVRRIEEYIHDRA